MSNHDSAYSTETLLINWSNGIRTLLVAPTWNVKRIKDKIIERLPEWKQDRDEGLKNYDHDCASVSSTSPTSYGSSKSSISVG